MMKWSLTIVASLTFLLITVTFGQDLASIQTAVDENRWADAVTDAKIAYRDASGRDKVAIKGLMRLAYGQLATEDKRSQWQVDGRITRTTEINRLRTEAKTIFGLRNSDVPPPPVFDKEVSTVTYKPISFDTKAMPDLTVKSVTFNTEGISDLAAAGLFDIVGADQSRDHRLAKLTFNQNRPVVDSQKRLRRISERRWREQDVFPGKGTRPPNRDEMTERDVTLDVEKPPAWFLSFGVNHPDITSTSSLDLSSQINYPNKTLLVSRSTANDFLNAYGANDRFVAVIHPYSLPTTSAHVACAQDPRVMMIVVGHYVAADVTPAMFVMRAAGVRSTIKVIRSITPKPIYLAVSTVSLVGGGMSPQWASEFNSNLIDGYAVYNLHQFAAFEGSALESVRQRLVLDPAKPVVLLDFVGGPSLPEAKFDPLHLEIMWTRKIERFIKNLQQDGWSGMAIYSSEMISNNIKAKVVGRLPQDLQYKE